MRDALTEKQKRFVEEYIIDLNAAGAARRAGYSSVNADKIGSELLGKTRVHQAIQERMSARSTKLEITADAVLKELAAIAFSDVRDFFEFNGEQVSIRKDIFSDLFRSKAISAITIGKYGNSIHFHDRIKALELLLKHVVANPGQSSGGSRKVVLDRLKALIIKQEKRQTEPIG